ncbi:hypothetical protein BABINDRAFT_92141 [Babjeviella inositovora NRRL Y-12698]|uniref:Uncharacterized protein n=1 Tax=Babjeviella inositovora NRRL Y-12698 TaxID=984486 RepID=A0A1E3QLT6_9ASCO|nr:uncharacterized protein BABINDRAFT_92141 [Babjeviella inositovora NRRL Y-12698]ODQ78042.1 hypothetical protein BABINDRAFT_92141 [Babjeviella inositovora NRRL Y-12698]
MGKPRFRFRLLCLTNCPGPSGKKGFKKSQAKSVNPYILGTDSLRIDRKYLILKLQYATPNNSSGSPKLHPSRVKPYSEFYGKFYPHIQYILSAIYQSFK